MSSADQGKSSSEQSSIVRFTLDQNRQWVTPRGVLVSGVAIIALHILQEALLGTSAVGSLLANALQISCALLATAACLLAIRRSTGFARSFWLLIALSFVVWVAADLGWVYYESYLRLAPPRNSIFHFLIDCRWLFLAIALLLDQNQETLPYFFDPASVLDTIQLFIVFVLIYLGWYHVPSFHESPNLSMLRSDQIQLGEHFAVMVLGVLQLVRARTKELRKLYLGLLICFLPLTAGTVVTDYVELRQSREISTGTWFDLFWTVSFLMAAFWAARWESSGKSVDAARPEQHFFGMLFENTMYALGPLIVLLQVAQLTPEWRRISLLLLGISIFSFGARLALSKFRENHAALRIDRINGALVESEDRYRDLVEHSEDLVCTHDLEGNLLSMNPAPARLLGYEVDELLKIPMRDQIVPEYQGCFDEYLARIKSNGADKGLMVVMTRSGERRIWEYSNTLRTDDVPQPIVRGIAHDVTDKRRAELALRHSERRYRTLFEKTVAGVGILSLDGRIIDCNDAWAHMLGHSKAAECHGLRIQDYYFDPSQRTTLVSELEETGFFLNREWYLRKKDGSPLWVLLNSVLLSENELEPLIQSTMLDITSRMQAQQALLEAKAFSENLIQTANVMILGLDTDGNVNLLNSAGEEITGYTFAELNGKSWSALVPRDRFSYVWEEFDRLVAGTAGDTFENPIVTKNGEERHIAWQSSVLKVNGKIVATISFGNDITERKRAEIALGRHKQDYRSFVGQSSEGVFRQDMDAPVPINLPEDELIHHILHDSYMAECNDALARMYGFTSGQQLTGKRLSEMLAVDDPHNIELTRQYIRSGFRVMERESHELDAHGNAKVFRNSMIGFVENGRLVRTWGIQRDVTEQVKLEESRAEGLERLRKSEEHFRLLVEQATEGIFLADAQGKYQEVNSAGVSMLGYTRDELLQMSIADIVVQEDIPRIPQEVAHFAGGRIAISEWKFQRKDGSIFTGEVCGRQLPDGRLQGILRDVTERRKAEESLRQSEERFRVALKDSPITVFNQDRDLRYTWIYNSQLYWQDDVLGKTDEEILGKKKAAALTALKMRVLRTGIAAREEVAIPLHGHECVFDMTIEPLFDGEHDVVGITSACMDIARLHQMATRLQESRDQIAREKAYLETQIQSELGFEDVIGQSSSLREVLRKAQIVAPTDSTVLLLGETGTGKELIARSLHALSTRREKTFVKLNCAAVPSGLLESELFGHEKGAFTGAVSQKVGRIELADKGTLFLDEIGEMPLELQPKLLRVLQDREFERLGGVKTLHVDVRIVSATNRDLQQDVADKKFREDLFYRLNVFPIELPALRDRKDDIPMLVRHFVAKHAGKMGKRIESVTDEVMQVLRNWNWPGNIRELENMIERMVILTHGHILAKPPIELMEVDSPADDHLTQMEREHIIRVLRETNGVLSGAEGAAVRLGLKRTTLQSMMKRLGIETHDYRGKGNGAFPRY